MVQITDRNSYWRWFPFMGENNGRTIYQIVGETVIAVSQLRDWLFKKTIWIWLILAVSYGTNQMGQATAEVENNDDSKKYYYTVWRELTEKELDRGSNNN